MKVIYAAGSHRVRRRSYQDPISRKGIQEASSLKRITPEGEIRFLYSLFRGIRTRHFVTGNYGRNMKRQMLGATRNWTKLRSHNFHPQAPNINYPERQLIWRNSTSASYSYDYNTQEGILDKFIKEGTQ